MQAWRQYVGEGYSHLLLSFLKLRCERVDEYAPALVFINLYPSGMPKRLFLHSRDTSPIPFITYFYPSFSDVIQTSPSIPSRSPIGIHRLLRKRPMRRKPISRRRRIAWRRTIAPQHEPIGREQRGVEIRTHPRHVEREPEGITVGEIRRDGKTRRLGVDQGEVGVADGCGRLVGHLGGAVCAADAGGREGDVLLEPDEVGGDGGTEICGCVDYDGDVGFVERADGAERGGEGGDCVYWVRGHVD